MMAGSYRIVFERGSSFNLAIMDKAIDELIWAYNKIAR